MNINAKGRPSDVGRLTVWTALLCGPTHRLGRLTVWAASPFGPPNRVGRLTVWAASPCGPPVVLPKAN